MTNGDIQTQWDQIFGSAKNKPFSYRYIPPPETLYHYTNFAGLVGILRSNRIWATNARYLNDMTEARQLWIFLENRVRAIIAAGRQVGTLDLLELSAHLRRAAEVGDDSFVASFSEARDSLSQWRAYSRGGPGICIGFSGAALNTQWVHNPNGEPHFTGMQFEKVDYIEENDSSFDDSVEQLLLGPRSSMFAEAIRMTNSHLSSEEQLVKELLVIQSRFKHAAFREEQEWRLSYKRWHKPMRHQQFRFSPTMLIPYIEAELNRNQEGNIIVDEYVREIIVGPSAHPELNCDAVKQFLHSLGRTAIPVKPSGTPYRDW